MGVGGYSCGGTTGLARGAPSYPLGQESIVKLPAPAYRQAGTGRGLPGNVDMITGSAFLPAPAYRQEGGASSRLARDIKLDYAL